MDLVGKPIIGHGVEAHAFVQISKSSFVRIFKVQNIVICPNRFSEYCHLSESTFRILSFVRIDLGQVICPIFYPFNMLNTRKTKLEIETRIQIDFNFELT